NNISTVRSRTHRLPWRFVRYRAPTVKSAVIPCAGSFTTCNRPPILHNHSQVNQQDSPFRSTLPWSAPIALWLLTNFIESLAHYNSEARFGLDKPFVRAPSHWQLW